MKDDIGEGQKSITSESPVSTLVHDMIDDDPTGMFPLSVDFRHFAIVSRATRSTYL